MGAKINLIGQKFGRWTVISEAPKHYMPSGDSKVMWNCLCECGNTGVVSSNNLKNGTSSSCGCYHDEIAKKRMTKRNRKYNRYEIKDDYVIVYTEKDEFFYIDLEDLEKIKKYYWLIHPCKGMKYVISTTKNRKEIIKLHRLLLNVKDDNVVDHINHNTLDNRKKNLRIVTQKENSLNHRRSINNTSGITGVSWITRLNKWQAYITFNKKRKYLGVYQNFDDAVAARKEAEEKYFGEYSYDNSMKIANQIKI